MNQPKIQSTCVVKLTGREEQNEKLFQFSYHSSFDILISSDKGRCVSFKFSYTVTLSLKKKQHKHSHTYTVKELPLQALLAHALHTNFLSSLTIPTHYDGVLMNKSVTDTHTNTFAQNALKVKTMSHLLCGNLSKRYGVAGITLHIHTMSRQKQVICF